MPDPARQLGATITIAADGEVRVRMEGLSETPKNLGLKLSHPATATHVAKVFLELAPEGDYVGTLRTPAPGRWVVTLESDAWRLPTTTVANGLSEIRLGTAAHP